MQNNARGQLIGNKPIFKLDYHGIRKINAINESILHYHRAPDMSIHRPFV